jgi:hypothetical protein
MREPQKDILTQSTQGPQRKEDFNNSLAKPPAMPGRVEKAML